MLQRHEMTQTSFSQNLFEIAPWSAEAIPENSIHGSGRYIYKGLSNRRIHYTFQAAPRQQRFLSLSKKWRLSFVSLDWNLENSHPQLLSYHYRNCIGLPTWKTRYPFKQPPCTKDHYHFLRIEHCDFLLIKWNILKFHPQLLKISRGEAYRSRRFKGRAILTGQYRNAKGNHRSRKVDSSDCWHAWNERFEQLYFVALKWPQNMPYKDCWLE